MNTTTIKDSKQKDEIITLHVIVDINLLTWERPSHILFT